MRAQTLRGMLWIAKHDIALAVLLAALGTSTACTSDTGTPREISASQQLLSTAGKKATPTHHDAGESEASTERQSVPPYDPQNCRSVCRYICDPDTIPPPPNCCGTYPACWCQCIKKN